MKRKAITESNTSSSFFLYRQALVEQQPVHHENHIVLGCPGVGTETTLKELQTKEVLTCRS